MMYSEQQDFYEVLGIARNASKDEIKNAYRRKARIFHPDVNQTSDSSQKFYEIKTAYENLCDEDKRREHDAVLDWYESLKQPKNQMYRFSQHQNPVSDFFSDSNMFWDKSGNLSWNLPKEDTNILDIEMKLTPEEAQRGGPIAVTIPLIKTCPLCSGTHQYFGCPTCKNKGEIEIEKDIWVNIPPYIQNGSLIMHTLADLGMPEMVLHITISIQNNINFWAW